jgi:hypothetical protein
VVELHTKFKKKKQAALDSLLDELSELATGTVVCHRWLVGAEGHGKTHTLPAC